MLKIDKKIYKLYEVPIKTWVVPQTHLFIVSRFQRF